MKKAVCKKAFVRNTEQTVPKTVLVNEAEPKPIEKVRKSDERILCSKPNVKFDNPEPNSTLQLVQKIKTLENLKSRKTKSASDLSKKQQLVVNEKISKKVNFPYCQEIYKDLIPLCVKMQAQQMVSSREPLPLRDKEPILSDFVSTKTLSEYSYKVAHVASNETFLRQYDGLKLYRTMQCWS